MSEVILEVLESGAIERRNYIPLFAINPRADGAYVLSVTGWVEATGALEDERYFVGSHGPASRASQAVAFRVEEIIQSGIVDRQHLSPIVRGLLGKTVEDIISRPDEIALQREDGSEISGALDVTATQIRRKLEDSIVTSVTEVNNALVIHQRQG